MNDQGKQEAVIAWLKQQPGDPSRLFHSDAKSLNVSTTTFYRAKRTLLAARAAASLRSLDEREQPSAPSPLVSFSTDELARELAARGVRSVTIGSDGTIAVTETRSLHL